MLQNPLHYFKTSPDIIQLAVVINWALAAAIALCTHHYVYLKISKLTPDILV